jgi:hypothetical protein
MHLLYRPSVEDWGVPPPSLLRALRASTRRGQRELAAAAAVSQAQYSRIEAGTQRLNAAQWLDLAQLLALGTSKRGPSRSDLRYVLYRVPKTADGSLLWVGNFIRDDMNQLGVFSHGENACKAAGTLELFELGDVSAICCTPTVIQDALFTVGGAVGERLVDSSRRARAANRYSGDLLGSLDFAYGALRRFLADENEAEQRALYQRAVARASLARPKT